MISAEMKANGKQEIKELVVVSIRSTWKVASAAKPFFAIR